MLDAFGLSGANLFLVLFHVAAALCVIFLLADQVFGEDEDFD